MKCSVCGRARDAGEKWLVVAVGPVTSAGVPVHVGTTNEPPPDGGTRFQFCISQPCEDGIKPLIGRALDALGAERIQ